MKKAFTLILVCVLTLTLLAGCGKKTEAVKAVEDQIKALGTITLESADAVSEAQSAYAALSEDEKKTVSNYDDLTKAAEALKALQTKMSSYDLMNSVIDSIIEAANSTFSADGTDFSELIAEGEEIIEQYKDLDAEGKAYVKVNDDLKTAIETLKNGVDRTTESAAEYVKAFNSLFSEEAAEVTAVYCIKQVRDETEYHIFALSYKDADGNETTVYANARCSANTTAKVIEQNADAFFAKTPVSTDYNAAENGNVALDLAAVLEKAK